KWPLATAVPKRLDVRLEIVKAMRALAPDQNEALRQRQAEIASIRRELEEIAQVICKLRRDAPALVLSELRKYGYNPDEPRVPKGKPGGGQWTSGGGSGSSANSTTRTGSAAADASE